MAKVRTCPKWLISGVTEAGYYVYTYIAGTSTPKDTYTDNTEATANTNPVILDSRGEADIWWSGTYKVAVYTGDKDTDGVLVWSVDDYGEGEELVSSGDFNLVQNGSFENDTITTDEPDSWTIVDYSTGVHELDDTDQYHGLKSIKFTSVGTGGGYATSEFFEVQEAKQIYVDWVMRSSVVDVRNVVDIIWYTSAKTSISTTNIYDDSATNPTSWTEKTGSGTPPATARYAQLRIYGCHSSDPTAGSTWFDNINVSISPPKATQAEVDAGTEASKYVTPETLQNKTTFRGCFVYLDANQSIPTGIGGATIAFDQEAYDTDNIHDNVTNNTRLTVPTGVTKVKISALATFGLNATGDRGIFITKNGSLVYAGAGKSYLSATGAHGHSSQCVTPSLEVVAGDYFTLLVFQDSGVALNAIGSTSGKETWLAMEITDEN